MKKDYEFENDPKLITANCPICMGQIAVWSDVGGADCPTCDTWVNINGSDEEDDWDEEDGWDEEDDS